MKLYKKKRDYKQKSVSNFTDEDAIRDGLLKMLSFVFYWWSLSALWLITHKYNDLVQSFLHRLPFWEEEKIESFANGIDIGDIQPLVDNFSESGIYKEPTKLNIFYLCRETAVF